MHLETADSGMFAETFGLSPHLVVEVALIWLMTVVLAAILGCHEAPPSSTSREKSSIRLTDAEKKKIYDDDYADADPKDVQNIDDEDDQHQDDYSGADGETDTTHETEDSSSSDQINNDGDDDGTNEGAGEGTSDDGGNDQPEEDDADDPSSTSSEDDPVKDDSRVDYRPPKKFKPSSKPDFRRHLIVWHKDPATEALIHWGVKSYKKGQTHTVHLSKESRSGSPTSAYDIRVEGKETGLRKACDDDEFSNFRAQVKDLEPNTTYFYVIESGSKRSDELHFVTGPANGQQSFKFFSGGDSRSDHEDRLKANNKMQELMEKDPSYLALVHGGDYIEDGDECEQWKDWLDHHDETTTKLGRVLPIIPTFGNHEVGGEDLFTEIFGDPAGKERFYFHSKLGAIDLLVLNSEISVEGEQKKWLESRLKKLDKGERFLLAGYHRPAWPALKSPADTVAWIDLFEKHDLDLVLESDGHALKQTCPIRGGKCKKGGIIYVGEGGLGVPQRQASKKDEWYFKDGGYAMSAHHIQSIEISGGDALKMTYQVYYGGKFRHKLTFKPRQR